MSWAAVVAMKAAGGGAMAKYESLGQGTGLPTIKVPWQKQAAVDKHAPSSPAVADTIAARWDVNGLQGPQAESMGAVPEPVAASHRAVDASAEPVSPQSPWFKPPLDSDVSGTGLPAAEKVGATEQSAGQEQSSAQLWEKTMLLAKSLDAAENDAFIEDLMRNLLQ